MVADWALAAITAQAVGVVCTHTAAGDRGTAQASWLAPYWLVGKSQRSGVVART
jgi:hypothetical protein